MRPLIDELLTHLRAFLGQDAAVLLVVDVNDASCGFVVRALETIDQDDDDLHWSFSDDFRNRHEFTESIIARVNERRTLACTVLEQAGRDPWPPLPPAAFDRGTSAVERMRAVMLYTRDLSPDLDASRLIWGLFPGWIDDGMAYRAFINDLMAHDFGPDVWCHHMRVLVRDDADHPALRDLGQSVPGVRWYAPRLAASDIAQALEEQAADETRSPDERIQALVVLAGIDYAHQRLADAFTRYDLARAYFVHTNQGAMHALCLNGMGEVMMRAGNAEAARHHFEAALTPAIERLSHDDAGRADAIPVVLNVALNLGNLYLSYRMWADAAAYYEGASWIAQASRNAQVKMQCLENIGACRFELGAYAEAIKAWEEGTALARALQADDHLRTLLQRQRAAFDRLGLTDRRDKAEIELRWIGASARTGHSHV